MNQSLHLVCPHCDTVNRLPPERLAEKAKCGKCSQTLFAGTPLALDQRRFQQHVANSDLPLLIDFWAPWCGPCRMMAPAFEQAAAQLEPEVKLIKVNTEQEQQLAAKFAIRSIPTLLIIERGKELARQPGAMDIGGIVGWTRQQLQKV